MNLVLTRVITYKSIHYTSTNGLISMLIGSEITCV